MTGRELLAAARGALSELDLEARVAAAVPPGLCAPSVVAIGKAAPSMARGALSRYPRARLVVVAPDGTDARGLRVIRASHPLPDARSRRAADACLAAARDAVDLIVLVSGGASALACAPSPGTTLADKRAVTRAMLRSGASIQELNVVRKHLSRIKGGGLARFARGRVVTLVASDVIGGVASDIGSGPSVSDASTVREARALLRRYAPAYAGLPLVSTWRGPSGITKMIASPEELARAVARRLRERGLEVRVLPPSQATVRALASEYVRRARRLHEGTAIVRAAEPSIEIPPRPGRGGRATHVASLVARDLPPGAWFLALATDGIDGTSETAGALVDARLAKRAGPRLEAAIARFDTGPLHREFGTAVRGGPTGHNLADLHVLAATVRT